MPAFGTVQAPVRSQHDLSINTPDGMPSAYPPGVDTWWTGLHWAWEQSMPPAVTRASSIIINPLVRMSWDLHRPDGQVTQPGDDGYPAWLLDPQLAGGSSGGSNLGELPQLDRATRFDVFSRWIRDGLWLGRGVLSFRPDSAGEPLAGSVQNIAPTRLYRGEEGWALETAGTLTPIDDQGMVKPEGVTHPRRLIILSHSLPGGVLGWHRQQLALAGLLNSYATSTFESGVPSGVLTTDQPLSQSQSDQIRTEWETTQKRRRVAVLSNGAKYDAVVASPVDTELVAMGRLSNEQIAHAFELPAWFLDAAQNSMTYSNSENFRRDMIDGPLSSWCARLEEAVSSLFPWGTRMVIDFTEYTKPSSTGGINGAPSSPQGDRDSDRRRSASDRPSGDVRPDL